MTTENPKIPNDPRDAAAYWFARAHSGNFTVVEREHFRRWRQARACNEREYRALNEIWHASRLMPDDELRELLEASVSAQERQLRARRRWMVGAGASCAATVVAGVLGRGNVLDSPQQVLRYATARGEQRVKTLTDDSVIEMNVATQLVVRYYHHRRAIELVTGEAWFEVASNQDRPFFVKAGSVDIQVTGTVFTVRREHEQISVAVQSGSVQVSTGSWWARDKATLTAGMTARVDESTPLQAGQADVAALTAWRQGKVVFRDQPLEDVVREMNRYLAQPIHLTDSRLKRLSVAGVFGIRDADGFLRTLQAHMPVVVTRRPDGGASLSLLR